MCDPQGDHTAQEIAQAVGLLLTGLCDYVRNPGPAAQPPGTWEQGGSR